MRWLAFPLLLLLLTGCYKPQSATAPLGSEKNPLVMAFVPSTEAEQILDSGEELAQLLGQRTGLSIKPLLATSYVGIVEAMAVGKVHVGWLPPLPYVYAHERNGDKVILKVVRNGSPTYRGQILVRKDGGINDLKLLKGKRLAFPDPVSTSGYLYPMKLLLEAGLKPEEECELQAVGSHDAAVIALVKGNADAALCYDDARTKLAESDMQADLANLNVLAYTADIPADTVAVIDELDAALRTRLLDGLLALAADETGKKVLYDLYEIEGLVPAGDGDYDVVREMAQVLGLNIEQEVAKRK